MKNLILPLAATLAALGATTVATANPPAPKPETHCEKDDHHGGHATECPHEDGKGH